MLRANGLEMSVTSGGTGVLTLAAIPGKPNFYAFGNTGSRTVNYFMVDGQNCEGGFGTINLATGQLARGDLHWKFEAGTYTPHPATGINATTSAKVYCGPQVEETVPIPPPMLTGLPSALAGISLYPTPDAVVGTPSTFGGANNAVYWNPFKWQGRVQPNRAAFHVATAAASGGRVRLALYDSKPDVYAPGKFIWSDDTEIAVDTTGWKTIELAGLPELPPGYYFTAVGLNGSASAMRITAQGQGFLHEGMHCYSSAFSTSVSAFVKTTAYAPWATVGEDPTGYTVSASNGRHVTFLLGVA